MAPAEIADLAALIETASGNVVPDGHYPFLLATANERAKARGCVDIASYVRALAAGTLAGEWAKLLSAITIKESFFFRGPQQFRALSHSVIPELVAARRVERRLRVWSAGCAHGEEPGTIAIVFAEHSLLAGWDWQVTGTDVDEAALATARVGVYGERAVASVPEALRLRHFERRPTGWELARRLRARIEYRHFNLIHEPFPLPSTPYDLVFLRNVLIYFRAESQRRVLSGLAHSLAPDGRLFLGPAETLWQLSDEFEPVDLGDCFCYRLAATSPPPRRRQAVVPLPKSSNLAAPRHPLSSSSTPTRPADAAASRPASRQATGASGRSGLDIPARNGDPLSLAAACLVNNEIDRAAALISNALVLEPSNPTIRFLEGFCHDIAGRVDCAITSYRAALFLDPELFQVRLLLADALRRLGWQPRAEHEYRQVLAALDNHSGHEVTLTSDLPLPDRDQARRRCRYAIAGPRHGHVS